MNKVIVGSLLFLLFWSCKQTKTENQKDVFSTTDQSELFFQNVRALYYDRTIMPETKVHLYRLKNQSSESLIWPVIVYNWREDQAFLMLQSEQLELPVTLYKKRNSEMDSILFTGENMYNHLEVAGWLVKSTMDGYKIFTKEKDLFSHHDEIEGFQITFKDFERLIE